MAKKFLYFVAICIVLVLLALIALRVWSQEIAAIAMVPTSEFVEQEPLAANAYQDPALWYSRPGIGVSDPARWQPAYAGARAVLPTPAESEVPDFAVFFVHPTSYLSRDNWNAPVGEEEAERVARIYVRGMASPFNAASEIWAPRYRQATMGAFLTKAEEGQQAIDAAYADVREAYRYFLESVDDDTPIVLVGHSQGSLHLLRLLRDEVKDSAVAGRVVAAYAIGWPISVEHDIPALGIPACATPDQTGCVLSWSSFAEPADPAPLMRTYAESTGFDGQPRGDSQILCTNPLTGTFGGEAAASANLGTLKPDNSISTGELVPGAVPARCDARGLLLIGDPPEMGSYVLPGNNYHVYDIPLFWANTKADVIRRVDAFVQAAN
jgi:pimeloyl-ACP methyl ester carboxylesterase